MTNWKAPLTRRGTPCSHCREGRLCGYHHAASKVRTGSGGPAPKLTRQVLDLVAANADQASGHQELWEAAGVVSATWFRWLDAGAGDAKEGVLSPERELWECVKGHRRALARSLAGTAVQAARGVYRTVTDPATGKVRRVYQEPPDGRLAAQLASRLDPEALPPEHVEVEHSGDVTPIVLEFDASKFPKPKGWVDPKGDRKRG